MPLTRRGSSLIELLVALPIAALVAAAAAAALIASWRLVRTGNSAVGSAREFRHAQAALEADLRPLHIADLRDIRDTVLEFDATLGVGAICAVTSARKIDVIAIDPREVRGLSWASAVQSGDLVSAWMRDSAGGIEPVQQTSSVTDIGWGSNCAAAPWTSGWTDTRTVRLAFADGRMVHSIIVGSPITLKRRTRFSLYKSGNEWFLGRKTHNGTSWDVIQPVAGPFLSPANRGMTVLLLDRSGAPTFTPALAAALRVGLRATQRAVGNSAAKTDSAGFDIVLRSESARR